MPNSPHNSGVSPEGLRTYLEGVLPNSHLSIKPVNSGHQPLVLLQTDHVMAGFAFSNGDMKKSYEVLYQTFKTQFTEERGIWDELDLAFVFCVQPGKTNLDQFCSNVETDVYFCRKFVIPLFPPLSASLARLPFLPLTPLEGKTFRPASAQTFLHQCGVPTVLAKYIVIQRERGPERIVEDCISGEFGQAKELTPVANAPVAPMEGITESVRLESVTIKNFRAYRKRQTFPLGSDVTILYGPNGFGKTSFFDAIDFAVTGGIGRIASSDAHFTKVAQHLDSGSEESTVSLGFTCRGATRNIARNVKTRKDANLDGHQADRKTILAELTGRDIPAADRVENFVDLFRATHLFNQESQELTKDFSEDCCLPAEIVSRMLAFQDYANALNKADKVREVLDAALVAANKEIGELGEQISDQKKELQRLGQNVGTTASAGTIPKEFESFQHRATTLGLDIGLGQPDAAALRELRASIQARHGESQNRSRQLSNVIKDVGRLPKLRADVAALQGQLVQKETALTANEEKRVANESANQTHDGHISAIKGKLDEEQKRGPLFDWFRSTKPKYAGLLQQRKKFTSELSQIVTGIAELRASEEIASGEVRAGEARLAQIGENLKAARAKLSAVQQMLDSTTLWQANKARVKTIEQTEPSLQRSLEKARSEEKEISPQLLSLKTDEERLARQIAEVDKNQSEIKGLLSRLQGHIQTGVCPLCGHDHSSKGELIQRIQSQLERDAASTSRSELANVREKSRNLAEKLAEIKKAQQAVEAQIRSLSTERRSLQANTEKFVDSLAEIGIVAGPSESETIQALNARSQKIQGDTNELNRQLKQITEATEAARKKSDASKTSLTTRVNEETQKKAAVARNDEELELIQSDPRWGQIALETEDQSVAEEERLSQDRLNALKAELAEAQGDSVKMKEELGRVRQESVSLKNQIQALRTEIGTHQKSSTQITAALQQANLALEISEEGLLALIAEETRKQAELVSLRESASNLELVLDAVTTAAALTSLLENTRGKERALEIATGKRRQYQPWLGYFEKVLHLLSSQQSEAIATFTKEYGPRTSVIQRRLRSVYGFDDIEIQSSDSTIRVRVKRHGEELRPTDYFSQSQLQTLLLGLFLTACISQTWSGFSPVFMDDPVTHFDDLNTYAFLDLIVGLLESEVGKRQFIISTCDERLLQLARQKFRHLGERAIFYRFDAIGSDGPVVERITICDDQSLSATATGTVPS